MNNSNLFFRITCRKFRFPATHHSGRCPEHRNYSSNSEESLLYESLCNQADVPSTVITLQAVKNLCFTSQVRGQRRVLLTKGECFAPLPVSRLPWRRNSSLSSLQRHNFCSPRYSSSMARSSSTCATSHYSSSMARSSGALQYPGEQKRRLCIPFKEELRRWGNRKTCSLRPRYAFATL